MSLTTFISHTLSYFDKTKSATTNHDITQEALWKPFLAGSAQRGRYAGIVFGCVNKNSEAFAKTEFYMEKLVSEEYQPVERHPLLDIIADPHDSQTWYDIKRSYAGFSELKGEFYLIIRRLRNKQPYQLWPVSPDQVLVNTHPNTNVVTGYLIGGVTYSAQDVIPFHNFNPYDQNRGLGKIQAAMANLDNLSKARLWNSSIYENSARTDGVLSFPVEAEIDQKTQDSIRDYFMKRNSGAGNAGKVLVTTGGATYHQTSITPKELDYLESIKADEKFVQRVIFSVPDIVFGEADSSNYSNGVTALQIWQEFTIEPMVRYFCTQINEWLMPQFANSEGIRLNYRPVVTENREIVLNEATKLKNSGIITINEARARYNLPPVEGGDGIGTTSWVNTSSDEKNSENEANKEGEDKSKKIGHINKKSSNDSKQYNHEFIAKKSASMFTDGLKEWETKATEAYLTAGELATSKFKESKALDLVSEKEYQEIFFALISGILAWALIRGISAEEEYLGLEEGVIDEDNSEIIAAIAALALTGSMSVSKTFHNEIDKVLAELSDDATLEEIREAITSKTSEVSSWMSARLTDSSLAAGFGVGVKNTDIMSGQKLVKAWRTSVISPAPCALCIENEDYGWIPLDAEFPNVSAYSEDIAHPHCYCYQVKEPADLHP